jgi:hypothetical protein
MTTGREYRMTDKDWQIVHALAQSLSFSRVDSGVAEKLQHYLRMRRDVAACRKLLMALANNSETYLKMSDGERIKKGVSFVRTKKMAWAHKTLAEKLPSLLDSGRNAELQALMLGWVVRLMKYYKSKAGAEELSLRGDVDSLEHEISHPVIDAHNGSRIIHKKQIAKSVKPLTKTMRETVTLIEPPKSGKANVLTSEGQGIPCASISSYPAAVVGDTCRADVTYEGNKAIRAVFKGWR